MSERVRQALLAPDLCHREPEFSHLQDDIRQALLDVYGLSPSTWTAVLLTGSGTAAVEAMIASLVPPQGKLLVVENGVYGERMTAMARIHGISHTALSLAWGQAIDPDEVARALDNAKDVTHLAVVHHETTTGRLNRLDAIGAACRERGVQMLLDAVSSFGAERLEAGDWGVAACAATANKCLHGVPGTAFVVVQREALEEASPNARSLYLDLSSYAREQDRGSTPFTQSVQSCYALREALREFKEDGGWRARHERYRTLGYLVRSRFEELGILPLLPAGENSVVLTAYYLPDGMEYAHFHDGLKARGFVVYAGQGRLAANIFRISTMGAVSVEDMQRLVRAVEDVAFKR